MIIAVSCGNIHAILLGFIFKELKNITISKEGGVSSISVIQASISLPKLMRTKNWADKTTVGGPESH